MAVSRSPNYPQMDLGAALEAMRPAYKAEGRVKMSRAALASHLGYTSLNGRALAKLGAVRAYGLIEGREDDIRIAQDTIICLEAPMHSPERAEALARCASKPPIFKDIQSKYPTLPSETNLRFELIKGGYTPEAAGKAAANYLTTMRLIEDARGAYQSEESTTEAVDSEEVIDIKPISTPTPSSFPTTSPVQASSPLTQSQNIDEREWLRGPLSRDVSYRLIVSGEMGPKQLSKLIKLLQAQKSVLEDDDIEDE